MKQLHINSLINKLSRHKYYLLLLLTSFLISIVLILQYKYFVFRGTPIREISVFSKTFVVGCVQSFLLWLYITAVLYLFFRFFRLLIRTVKNLIQNIKSGSLPLKGLLLHLAIAALIVALVFGLEFVWGHFIAAKPTTAGSYFNRYRFLFLLASAFTVYFIILYYHKIIARFEHLFLALMLIIGCCYSFGLPVANISWDDAIHYQRALNASKLTECATTDAEYLMMAGSVPITYNISEINEWQERLNTSDRVVMSDARSYRYYYYQYISYLPSGLVMSICRVFNLPFIFTYCMGRFTNLIMYALIVFFAMKRLRSGKAILAVIAAFPINMFLASNYSYDWFLTAMVMLGFSYLIAEFQSPDEKITRKNACIMILSLFFGIGTKAIYFPLLLLCLLLPEKKFSSKKTCRYFKLFVAAATLITIASFLLPFLISSGASGTDTRGGSNVNAAEQIKYILRHPFTYSKTLLNFLFNDFLSLQRSHGYTCHFAYLGHANYSTPVMMLLTAACFTDHGTPDKTVLTGKFRFVTILLSFATLSLFATAMYAAFTDVGLDTINGCTQRYLEPLIFPIAFCVGSGRFHSGISKRLKYTLFSVCSSYILLASVWQISISRYF